MRFLFPTVPLGLGALLYHSPFTDKPAMDYIYLSRRRKSVILILTLLVHALFLLLLLAGLASDQAWYNPRNLFEQAHVLPQSPLTSPEATVVFQDDPAGTRGEPSVAETMADNRSAADTTPSQPHEERAQETIEQTLEQLQTIVQEQLQERQNSESTTTALIPPPLNDIQETRSVAEQAPGSQETTPPRDTSPESQPTPQGRYKRNYARQTAQGNPNSLTLGDITQGFLKSVQQEHGRTQKTSDAESMARQRYSTRVWSILKNSYRAHRSPTYLLSDLSTQAMLIVQLNKEGKLINIQLQHPNKTHDLYEVEQIIINAAKKAGLYPPIPATFNTDTITLSYPLAISVREGVHVYDFVYQ